MRKYLKRYGKSHIPKFKNSHPNFFPNYTIIFGTALTYQDLFKLDLLEMGMKLRGPTKVKWRDYWVIV